MLSRLKTNVKLDKITVFFKRISNNLFLVVAWLNVKRKKPKC